MDKPNTSVKRGQSQNQTDQAALKFIEGTRRLFAFSQSKVPNFQDFSLSNEADEQIRQEQHGNHKSEQGKRTISLFFDSNPGSFQLGLLLFPCQSPVVLGPPTGREFIEQVLCNI